MNVLMRIWRGTYRLFFTMLAIAAILALPALCIYSWKCFAAFAVIGIAWAIWDMGFEP